MSISECILQVKCHSIPPIQNISTKPNIKLLFSSNRQLQVTRMFAWQNRFAIKSLFGIRFVQLVDTFCHFVQFCPGRRPHCACRCRFARIVLYLIIDDHHRLHQSYNFSMHIFEVKLYYCSNQISLWLAILSSRC